MGKDLLEITPVEALIATVPSVGGHPSLGHTALEHP
jgi:hypothetical protein